MRIKMVRITEENTAECWLCGDRLWHEPRRYWNSKIQEHVTDPYQHAFKLRADDGSWMRWLCDTCSYTEADDLREYFRREAEEFEAKAIRLRAIADEPLQSPSEEDRRQEDATIAAWNT